MDNFNIEICIRDKKRYGSCYINCHNDECIINALGVFYKQHNKGIGTSLIKYAEVFIRDNLKQNTAILYVKEGTWQAEWYQRLGYQISGIQDGGEGYIRMEKNLK